MRDIIGITALDDKAIQMDADSSPGNPSQKRAVRPGFAARFFNLLRMFWVFALALLLVVLFGLRAGWSAPRQWSDGFFIAAFAQVIIAAVSLLGTRGEAFDASWVRYVDKGSVNDTRYELWLDALRKRRFGLTAFLGALLTFLIAALVLWV